MRARNSSITYGGGSSRSAKSCPRVRPPAITISASMRFRTHYARRDQSDTTDRQLRITKAGNRYLRRLLVGCAQYILGPVGPNSQLRNWGLKRAERGRANGERRAVVAVAHKLAVLLHRLGSTGMLCALFPDGSPPSVADQLARLEEEIRLGYLLCAPLSHDTFTLFTEKVLPKFL